MNDDILWKIDSEIGKDKRVVELNRIIAKLEEDNTCLRKALKTYEAGRYQEHFEIERLNNIIKNGINEELRKELDEILKCNQKQAHRIDKAIEYIETHQLNFKKGTTTFGSERLSMEERKLLDILRGEDK